MHAQYSFLERLKLSIISLCGAFIFCAVLFLSLDFIWNSLSSYNDEQFMLTIINNEMLAKQTLDGLSVKTHQTFVQPIVANLLLPTPKHNIYLWQLSIIAIVYLIVTLYTNKLLRLKLNKYLSKTQLIFFCCFNVLSNIAIASMSGMHWSTTYVIATIAWLICSYTFMLTFKFKRF